jgi:hypothetical protein
MFISNSVFSQTRTTEYKYKGYIGNSEVFVTFEELDHHYDRIQGYYVYTKYNKRIYFEGESGVFDGKQKLTENVGGTNTGYFIFYNLNYSSNSVQGKWFSMDGNRSYNVTLSKDN